MTEFFNFKVKTDLTGYTLLIPSVAVGNVPQLTTDLLITSLDLKKTATIWHPAILSSVGPDPYDLQSLEVCTACELYANETLKLAVIQLRSTIDVKLATKFFDDLKNAIVQYSVKDVVILTSSFDYEMHVVSSSKFRYISNGSIDEVMKTIEILPKEVEFNGKYLVHGSGFAVKLFENLKEVVPCTVLIKYVSEGDNRPDAINMLDALSKFVDCIKKCNITVVKFPSSWSGVFGGPPPLGMY